MAGLIDVGILKPELAGSFAAGYRGAEEQRNALAQRQQQAAQAEQQLASGRQRLKMDEMTMQRMQEDRAALTGLQAKLRAAGQSDDPQVFFRVMAESNDPNIMMKGIEGLQRYRALEAYDRQYGGAGASVMPASAPGAMAAPEGELVAAPITAPKGTMREIAPGGAMGAEMPLAQANTLAPPAAAPVNALALPAAAPINALSPAATAPNIDALRRQYSMAVAAGRSDAPVLLKQIEAALRGDQNRPVVVGNRLVSPTGQELYAAPERTDTDLIRNFNAAKAQGFRGNLFDYQREIAMASRPPAPPRQEPPPQPPVAVIDPASGNTIFVSREEALNRRMTPAGQGVSLTPKQMQTFEAKYPQATAAVKTFESKSDRLAADLETLANHPGLSGISGLIYGRTPAITAEARQAEALYDSIIARGGFQELQDMRAASPTGGALGPVSNTENQYLRDAFAPIKRTQDTPDLKQALLNAAQATNDSKQRIREAYDLTYEYRAQRGATPARNLTPQDQEALNWANSNPNDPRAAQIKQRLGATK